MLLYVLFSASLFQPYDSRHIFFTASWSPLVSMKVSCIPRSFSIKVSLRRKLRSRFSLIPRNKISSKEKRSHTNGETGTTNKKEKASTPSSQRRTSKNASKTEVENYQYLCTFRSHSPRRRSYGDGRDPTLPAWPATLVAKHPWCGCKWGPSVF